MAPPAMPTSAASAPGTSQSGTSASAPATRAATSPAGQTSRFTAVNLTFSPYAQTRLAAEPQFEPAGLSNAIETELRGQRLLDESNPEGGDTLSIVIDDFTARPSSNAVVFGYILSTGTLEGSLAVLTADGQQRRTAKIHAHARLVQAVNSGQPPSLQPLYQGFAGATARNLTGAAEPVAVNH
jgi:hypothetical protein